MDGPDNLNPRLDDLLFDSIFDWPAYCRSVDPSLDQYPSAHALEDLSSLVTGLPTSPPLLDHRLSLDELDADLELVRMTAREEAVATRSDFSVQTTPELVQGGSTSPSDHSGSLLSDQADESHHRPHVTLREAQAHDDEWTYPQTDAAKAVSGYPPHIHVHGDGPSAHAAGQKRRRSLNDPEKTADVRKTGACLPCRLTKTRCHESGVCPACRKSFPKQSHLVCTRKTPVMAWPILIKGPDVWSRNARLEERLCSLPRNHIGKPKEISIFLTSDTSSPPLLATVQPYTSNDDPEEATSLNKADFPREHVPSHPELRAWVEAQIRREQGPDFPQTLQRFLLAYAHGGRSLPKHDLVENVHMMNCFFRIWRTSSFSCRDPTNKMANLPLSVQARLRNIARKALKSYEYEVLKALDDCLGQHAQQKPSDRMAVWASLWQLILMYRDLLNAFEAKAGNLAAFDAESFKFHHRQLADTYFPLMAIFYHYQFRNRKSLEEVSLDFLHGWQVPGQTPQQKAELHCLGQQLLGDARKRMFQILEASEDKTDHILCKLVVENELKRLNARKRTRKDGAKSGPKA
ncbi:hypothetical protein XA68_12468 [Ophiocordyceps unilateralis]|uniref:Uncharacterized protein n=1 Tax=Ophiocordyceps unilateralis TaxID=268505 RepID=A0A2A9PEP2_OPHUN|nr:hypothetical protein XA68_12468 [Ophiocordyceps unilateralis]